MKYKFDYFTMLSFLFFASPMLSIAQNLPPISGKYTRSSITPIYIKHSDSRLSIFNFVDSVKISDKYDQNVIGNNTMDVVFKMISDTRMKYYELVDRSANAKNLPKEEQEALSKNLSEVSKQLAFEDSIRSFQIVAKLRSSKIPNRVLSSLLIDNKLGYMTLAKLEERALYDASDSDVLQANNSERKMASIKDRAVSMLNGVYFWIYDANEYKITDDEKDSRLKTHSLRGGVYLVKLDMDLLNQNGQFENLIFQEFSTSKLKAFKEFNFPVKVIFRKDFSASTSNYEIDYSGPTGALISSLGKEQKQKSEVKYIFKQDDQIQKELVSGTVTSANETFTANYEPFRVKSSVFATSPIRVKIGKKEELEIDHLFKVSEFRLDKSGNPFEKNVGWLRVKKVSDNRKKADGKMEPSVFYKVFSKGVDKGMKVQYVHEYGTVWGVSHNLLMDNIFSGPMLNFDYITGIFPGLRAGINFGGFTELKSPKFLFPSFARELDYDDDSELSFNGRNIIGEVTIQKIFQFNIIELTPYVGGYFSSTRLLSLNVDGEKISGTQNQEIIKWAYNDYGGLLGIKFGVNFGKYTQLNIGYKSGITFMSELIKDKEKEGYEFVGSLFQLPSNISIGLRLTGF
jgi:hypothetical protein